MILSRLIRQRARLHHDEASAARLQANAARGRAAVLKKLASKLAEEAAAMPKVIRRQFQLGLSKLASREAGIYEQQARAHDAEAARADAESAAALSLARLRRQTAQV